MDFTNRTVMITGAAGNLGRAVAETFFERNANLLLIDHRADRLTQIFGPAGARRAYAQADLMKRVDVERVAAAGAERFGGIDALCNLAGGFRAGEAVHETSDETLDAMLDVNVRTMLNAVRAVVPGMIARKRGAVVNVGAYGALAGGPNMGAYAASKSAVIRLTESLAMELRAKGVNVNCVLPTTIDTPENRAAMPDADPRRWVAPRDLAAAIVFLASDDARAMHGAAVPVRGLV
jgi:NAD(P)-dependent dehydrogenase (short-subunit alcohol dehydrogenase family)